MRKYETGKPMFEIGETVVETLGPEDDRIQRSTTIIGITKNGGFRTETAGMYNSVGLADPRPKNADGWRSIRRP